MAGSSVSRNDEIGLKAAFGMLTLAAVLWVGGALSARVSGHSVPSGRAFAGIAALATPGSPSAAWHRPVGPPVLYWTSVTLCVAVAAGVVGLFRFARETWSPPSSQQSGSGFAGRQAISKVAGKRSLVRRAALLRPEVERPCAADLGLRLGRANGHECWSSVEDSLVILGPPRSGKGLHLVISSILDSPGTVVTTSTRPDNLAATLEARRRRGPVAIFDPQGLAAGIESMLRWSPIRGCAAPEIAMARARVLCADPGAGVENASFWAQQCYTVVRCLLHAAALSGSSSTDLVRWSLSPLAAEDASAVLHQNCRAAPAWATALDAVLASDPRQRDSVWAMVANTFGALADPVVLAAVSPSSSEQFDPEQFLRDGGTLYLLGTASGAGATANLVSALIEDVVDAARRMAAASTGARLEPPLAVILDEAANYPLPSLLPLMSEGGGSGISTLVVLQSMAQARARWGQQEAAAIWDAAIVKVMLGGSANADDLRDLSSLAGVRDERRINLSWGTDGRRSSSESTHERPVLTAGALRTLPFGEAVLLFRSTLPIRLRLTPWTRRLDAATITADRASVEARLRVAARGPNSV